ncbi:MAG: hypothetical protein O2900_14060, partial [Proteobacteria bacterium]|nr:hypothetical protein [Pseudomonadota bacterium]
CPGSGPELDDAALADRMKEDGMGMPQKLEQDQYSLSVSLISHTHLQIKLDSMRLQEPLPSCEKEDHVSGG